jgi:hypothetical protein
MFFKIIRLTNDIRRMTQDTLWRGLMFHFFFFIIFIDFHFS